MKGKTWWVHCEKQWKTAFPYSSIFPTSPKHKPGWCLSNGGPYTVIFVHPWYVFVMELGKDMLKLLPSHNISSSFKRITTYFKIIDKSCLVRMPVWVSEGYGFNSCTGLSVNSLWLLSLPPMGSNSCKCVKGSSLSMWFQSTSCPWFNHACSWRHEEYPPNKTMSKSLQHNWVPQCLVSLTNSRRVVGSILVLGPFWTDSACFPCVCLGFLWASSHSQKTHVRSVDLTP